MLPQEPTQQPSNKPPEPSITTTMSSTPAAPIPSQGAPTPTPKRRWRFWLLLIVIIIAAAAGTAYYLHTKGIKPAAAIKKDIPYLTYGFSDSSDLTPNYPLEATDVGDTTMIAAQVYEGLVRYQNQTKIVPLLATSWSNPDKNTWVFDLRHGVTFHSGRTMTATDVKYSLDYAVAHQNDNNGNTTLALASTISQVTVVNPYQIKITTNGPDPVLLNRLTFLYTVDSKAKLGDPSSGSGPYVLKPGAPNSPTATTLDLVAFDQYWGGHVYTRAIHAKEDSSPAQLATDTANGKFDFSGDFNAEQLAKIKNYQPLTIQDLGITFLGLNTEKAASPMHSLAARQAAAYALDIPAVLKAGGVAGTQVGQLIPPTIPGYDPSIKPIPYNPTKAKQLLATVSDASAPLALSYPTGDDGQVAEIAKELNAVGFNVKLSPVADLGTLVNAMIAGQTDMVYLGYTTNTLDGLDIINTTVEGTQNYSSTQLADLANQASSTIDPSARIALLQKIEHVIASDVPAVPLYTQTRTFTLLKPYHMEVDIPSTSAGIYFWQVYQQ